jgi:predicted dehydrogenase
MIRWGMIGCGAVTERKSGPALQRAAGSSVVMVMRRDAAKCADYAARHGVPRWTTDADAVIHDPEVDAVYIATPPALHADYALRVAAAGKPVYVEKPLACTPEDSARVIDACAAAGVPLFVAYYRRALPRFLQVKAWLDGGAIGPVRAVFVRMLRPARPSDAEPANWRVQPAVSGGGYLFDVGSHMLDLLDFLLGPITATHGAAANQAGLYAAEDTVAAHFTFANGALGVGLWCYAAHPNDPYDVVELIGADGRITYSTFSEVPLRLENADGVTALEIPNPPYIQQPLVQTIVDELHGHGRCPSRGDTALRTDQVLAALTADYRIRSTV